MIGSDLGRYHILEKIGEGGMGVVYRAKDTRLVREVAIKVLPTGLLGDETRRRRFRREALALSRMNHPNIEIVYDFDSQDEVDFLVMEYIHGTTLYRRIADNPLPETETVNLAQQLTAGLAAAHGRGVLHRDIKPANVMITTEGRLKILDFGLAKLLTSDPDIPTSQDLTESQTAMGTVPYMSPEELLGNPADRRSDLYSVGTVLYEMATGQRAFRSRTNTALIEKILHGAPPPPSALNPGISSGLERIISKCMVREPDQRYQSADELLSELRRHDCAGSTSLIRRALGGGAGPRRWVLFAAGAVALALVAIGVARRDKIRARLVPQMAASIESVAVLPLENLSGADQQYFVDGMTDMLIMDLAQIGALRVISRTSAMHYRETTKRLPEIAKELGVSAIVSGAVFRSGERVRITAQLIHAPTDRLMWADSYERDLVDVLDLQGEVASEVARQIRVKLTPQEQDRLRSGHPVDPKAYETYLMGRHYLAERSIGGFQRALRLFEQSIERDPHQALAHVGVANCYALFASIGYDVMRPSEAAPRAREAVTRALEFNENLAEVHTAVAHLQHNYEWNLAEAQKSFQRALELNPGYATAHSWYGFYLASLGKLGEAIDAQKKALELDPLSAVIHTSIGRIYYYADQTEQAIVHLERAREIEPAFLPAHALLGMCFAQSGDFDAALASFQRGHELSHGAPVFVAGLGVVHALSGDLHKARRAIADLAELSQDRYVPAFYTSVIHAGLGESREALNWLETAFEERSEAILYLGVEPLLADLRSNARFQGLMSRVGPPAP